jgi:hypothetical protein
VSVEKLTLNDMLSDEDRAAVAAMRAKTDAESDAKQLAEEQAASKAGLEGKEKTAPKGMRPEDLIVTTNMTAEQLRQEEQKIKAIQQQILAEQKQERKLPSIQGRSRWSRLDETMTAAIFEYLLYADLRTTRDTCPFFRHVLHKFKLLDRMEMICFHRRVPFTEDILGFGITPKFYRKCSTVRPVLVATMLHLSSQSCMLCQ